MELKSTRGLFLFTGSILLCLSHLELTKQSIHWNCSTYEEYQPEDWSLPRTSFHLPGEQDLLVDRNSSPVQAVAEVIRIEAGSRKQHLHSAALFLLWLVPAHLSSVRLLLQYPSLYQYQEWKYWILNHPPTHQCPPTLVDYISLDIHLIPHQHHHWACCSLRPVNHPTFFSIPQSLYPRKLSQQVLWTIPHLPGHNQHQHPQPLVDLCCQGFLTIREDSFLSQLRAPPPTPFINANILHFLELLDSPTIHWTGTIMPVIPASSIS